MRIPDEAVAAHELGHVLTGKYAGIPLDKVRVFKAGWFSDQLIGVCYSEPVVVPFDEEIRPDRDFYENYLATFTGGQAAMEMWYEEFLPADRVPWAASADKALHAKDLAYNPPEWRAVLDFTWEDSMRHARKMLTPVWDELLGLIPVLLEKKTLRQRHI